MPNTDVMEKSTQRTDCKSLLTSASKKKVRPTQRLYVPPAQRNKKKSTNVEYEGAIESEISTAEFQPKLDETETNFTSKNNIDSTKTTANIDINVNVDSYNLVKNNNTLTEVTTRNYTSSDQHPEDNNKTLTDSAIVKRSNVHSTINDESLVIMLESVSVEKGKVEVDVEQEEMERAIVNINRKSRPLIRHVNVGNSDILRIDVDDREIISKPVCKSKKLAKKVYEQIANWEDLFNEDACECNGQYMEQIVDYIDNKSEDLSEDETRNKKIAATSELEHVIELYDFPSAFKTQDLIQLYHDVNEESMYIKWCDETHALLVLSTPAQAKKALQIDHDIIKSRTMLQASLIAKQVATRCDLKPAMKRPQTSMQTARRLITAHLGTRSRLSKEEQQRERDELRKAKEMKRALRQSENDAWDGHPRPSTA